MSRDSLLTLWLDFSPTLLLRIKGVKIMEKDKDFLGTEPIGKLLLRLANPLTLAAQLINMLYNCGGSNLHRSYPEGRSFGSYGCRCVHAAYHDRVSICSAGRKWRCAESVYLYGTE